MDRPLPLTQLSDELKALGYDHLVTERTPYGFRVYPFRTTQFFYFDHYGQPLKGL